MNTTKNKILDFLLFGAGILILGGLAIIATKHSIGIYFMLSGFVLFFIFILVIMVLASIRYYKERK